MNVFTALADKLFSRKNNFDFSAPLCPLPKSLDLAQISRVMVFAPHPDDEAIGCGGLLALLARQGCKIRVVLVTDGGGAGGLPASAARTRQQEFIAALGILGIDDWRMLGFVDGAVDADTQLEATLLDTLADFMPDTVIMPSMLDLHRDHRAIAVTLARCSTKLQSVRQYIQYEVWCPLPATHLIDISAVAETKWAAIGQHRTALKCGDYLTASLGLARYRGLLLGRPGTDATAEAFVVETTDVFARQRQHWLTYTAQQMLL